MDLNEYIQCRWCGASRHGNSYLFHVGARDCATARTSSCRKCGYCFTEQPGSEARAPEANPHLSGQLSLEVRGAAAPSEVEIGSSEAAALERFQTLYKVFGNRLLAGGRVLEVGCGIGSVLPLLVGLGWKAHGIEPDPEYARTGRQLYGLEIDTDLLEDTPIRCGSFDLVMSFHVLERVADPKLHLSVIRDVVKRNGHLFLEVPVLDLPAAGDLDRFFWTRHPNVFSKEFLDAAVQQQGFAIETNGTARTGYWGLFRREGRPTSRCVTRIPKPPVLKARWLNIGFRIAEQTELSKTVWRASWMLATHQLNGDNVRGIRTRVNQVARKIIHNTVFATARKRRLAHFGINSAGNAGDVVLSVATRAAIESAYECFWIRKDLRRVVTSADVKWLNRKTSGIVVGGGGLFLADTNPNSISGWQWPISTDLISRIEVPLSMFSVGYNKFRGQERLSTAFSESLQTLAEKCHFIGIRNRGSIRELVSYLPEKLRATLVFQPCPTTVLSHLSFAQKAAASSAMVKAHRPVLALNVAFDRYGRRFGAKTRGILSAIASAVRVAQQDGWEIVVARHAKSDAAIGPYLAQQNVSYSTKDLCFSHPSEVISFYSSIDLSIGMRGHAQMIPFGLGVPIISLIAHDKLAWFLEDIGYPEWGADVSHDSFPEDLLAIYRSIASDLPRHRRCIVEARERLWAVTQDNVRQIREVLVS
jgi:polysaccharide pyruvyl transferase WcaK-like protein/SAM-dependent methyltransferase